MVGEPIKEKVIAGIAGGTSIQKLLKAKVRIGKNTVHVRFRTNSKPGGTTYSFNVNPNTLTADFELWICGSTECYYLIPISEIEHLYQDPNAYPDYQHPKLRVIDINTHSHSCKYGTGALYQDFNQYFCATLPD